VAVLATFAACLGGTLRVILEVAPAYVTAFLAGLGSALGVFREIAFTAAMFSHFQILVSNLVLCQWHPYSEKNEEVSVHCFLMT
jgi:hypothetical protein